MLFCSVLIFGKLPFVNNDNPGFKKWFKSQNSLPKNPVKSGFDSQRLNSTGGGFGLGFVIHPIACISDYFEILVEVNPKRLFLSKADKTSSPNSTVAALLHLSDLSFMERAALTVVNKTNKPDLTLKEAVRSLVAYIPILVLYYLDNHLNNNIDGCSDKYFQPTHGYIKQIVCSTFASFDQNGIPDLLIMSVDNPNGND